ncbi:hypothetical protein DPMN_146356 [Dreissena polymorpha]|uniref:Uncharacterized protein n=1 Tax=Dreissena polymorpha TaxID=45954 RepID=A0A9D4FBM0_DREPO|nr:hypothetical protein DPMN_146356 [Dreissena polymorpha]
MPYLWIPGPEKARILSSSPDSLGAPPGLDTPTVLSGTSHADAWSLVHTPTPKTYEEQ